MISRQSIFSSIVIDTSSPSVSHTFDHSSLSSELSPLPFLSNVKSSSLIVSARRRDLFAWLLLLGQQALSTSLMASSDLSREERELLSEVEFVVVESSLSITIVGTGLGYLMDDLRFSRCILLSTRTPYLWKETMIHMKEACCNIRRTKRTTASQTSPASDSIRF